MDPVTAVVLSVTVVLLFGEIIPQVRRAGATGSTSACPEARRAAAPRSGGAICPPMPGVPCSPPRAPLHPPAQAACSRFGLQIGAYSASFVRVLIFVTAPLNVPIGWVLDKVLGQRHTALFRRGGMRHCCHPAMSTAAVVTDGRWTGRWPRGTRRCAGGAQPQAGHTAAMPCGRSTATSGMHRSGAAAGWLLRLQN